LLIGGRDSGGEGHGSDFSQLIPPSMPCSATRNALALRWDATITFSLRTTASAWAKTSKVSGQRLPRPDELPPQALFLAKPYSADRLIETLNAVVGDDANW